MVFSVSPSPNDSLLSVETRATKKVSTLYITLQLAVNWRFPWSSVESLENWVDKLDKLLWRVRPWYIWLVLPFLKPIHSLFLIPFFSKNSDSLDKERVPFNPSPLVTTQQPTFPIASSAPSIGWIIGLRQSSGMSPYVLLLLSMSLFHLYRPAALMSLTNFLFTKSPFQFLASRRPTHRQQILWRLAHCYFWLDGRFEAVIWYVFSV